MIDLHTHTTASDGTLSPKELINYAVSKKLNAIAITDHDTISGLKEAENHLKTLNTPLKLINGIELSTNIPKHKFDIHILGLNVDPNNSDFINGLSLILEDRNMRNIKMLKLINELGYSLTLDELKDYAKDSVITRAHIAAILVAKNYFKNNNQVFNDLIGNGKPAYVSRKNVNAKFAIDLLNSTGAIPILAHPTLYGLDSNQLYGLIHELKSYGLKGIESYYSLYTSKQHAHMRNLAKKFNLIEVGGSDYHGDNKPNLDLRVGYGNLNVPDLLLENILV